MKRKIIFDCDNTMGLKLCDVDDGLALLCILDNNNVELLAITTSFGNNETEIVYKNTINILKELKLNIKVYMGGKEPLDYDNKASKYIAEMIELYPGEIEILSTGSLTNIAGALRYSQNMQSSLKAIYLMGGITEELIFKKRRMEELNFSIDYKSSYEVLTKLKNINILTGNNCLDVIFGLDEYKNKLSGQIKVGKRNFFNFNTLGEYVLYKSLHWFEYNNNIYGIDGFYNWDATAALYLLYPEIFEDNSSFFDIKEYYLKDGYLKISDSNEGILLNLPKIKNYKEFKDKFYKAMEGRNL